jgi:hypothetical protein
MTVGGEASSDGDHRSASLELGARERAAVRRLVERVAHGCEAVTTWWGPPLGDGAAAPEHADVVVACERLASGGDDWRARVADLGSRATKRLVVVGPNPHRGLGVGGSVRGEQGDLARLLWELGRVRDHAYLVFPRAVEVVAAARGQVLAPDLAHAPVGALVRRTAHLHGFVVDTVPRSRQARRRLRIAGASGEPG